ncbi:MAG TPA: hypothetical protein EYQ53_03090 [Candidatus Poseidoniales archaeon]|jgi:rRNA maturation endonuclease Nob1|nr:MAG: hypothetical protein CXT69_00505 [Euryarchaeota archaeon]HIG03353.1 hypothetical protein [Candidatus Poseidoniales archaeon]HIK78533.1 hypothetical protein [Candidatus Poseidoniales archaeon]
MEIPDILDTSALLAWPPQKWLGCFCVFGQIVEMERHSPERAMLLENQGPDFIIPDPASVSKVEENAALTGDLPRLSPVDVELLALTQQLNGTLHTDDYRMQNVARKMQLSWKAVSVKASKAAWSWILLCSGCRAVSKVESSDSDNIPECGICGSPQKLKRSK